MIGIIVGIIFLIGTASGEAKKILLSEEGAWPPYTYESEGTPTKGLSLELMEEIFHRLQIPYELKLYPQQRCIEQMKTGERDAMTLISKSRDREDFLDFTIPVMESPGLLYYSADRSQPIQWNNFSDLRHYKIGIVIGYNYGEAFNKARKQLNVQEVVKIEQNLKKLLAGRIDIIFANQDEISEIIKKNPDYKGKIRTAEKPYISYTYHMGFSKKSEARWLIPSINQVILEMKADGTLARILEE
jgi:polar amino acid transport system substrate-binding protein